MKKSLAILVLAASIPFGIIHAGSSKTFADIEGHWAKDSVIAAAEKGYVDGYEDGTFKPEKPVTRAEFVKILLTGLDYKQKEVPGASEWYRPFLEGAAQEGIYRDSDFRGDINEPITRLEMSQLALRASDETLRTGGGYLDDKSAMYQSTKRGLLQGLSGGELAPDSLTTRAQAVTIIGRAQKLQKGDKLPVDKAAVSKAEIEATGTNMRTMLGEQPIAFPYEFDYYGNKAKINKLIIVDIDDPTSAYYELLDGAYVGAHNPVPSGYLFAFDLSVDVQNPYTDGVPIYTNNFTMQARPRVITNNFFNGAFLTKPGLLTGYMAYVYPKDLVKVDNPKFFIPVKINGQSVKLTQGPTTE